MVDVTQTHEPIIFKVILVSQFFFTTTLSHSDIINYKWQTMSKCLLLSGRFTIFFFSMDTRLKKVFKNLYFYTF